jgi:ABC-2 type transport system permease protein
MRSLDYTRFEIIRTLRNKQLVMWSLGFPLVLFGVIAWPNRDVQDFADTGISLPLYYMVGLVAFGAMMALISNGARIATERTEGWTRQLRVTPLAPSAYLRAKVVTGYVMALLTIAVLYTSGASLGVRMAAETWLEMTGLILIGLLPFAALGILLGHLFTADTIGPATGGLISLLALVSGTWFPLPEGGIVQEIAQYLPSYWLVQASHVSLGGGGWSATGWAVTVGWTLALALLARAAYRRDTERI